jgi:hypothetical protein
MAMNWWREVIGERRSDQLAAALARQEAREGKKMLTRLRRTR